MRPSSHNDNTCRCLWCCHHDIAIVMNVPAVHLMNADSPSRGSDPHTKKTNLLPSTPTIAIYYYYSAQKLTHFTVPQRMKGACHSGCHDYDDDEQRTTKMMIARSNFDVFLHLFCKEPLEMSGTCFYRIESFLSPTDSEEALKTNTKHWPKVQTCPGGRVVNACGHHVQ